MLVVGSVGTGVAVCFVAAGVGVGVGVLVGLLGVPFIAGCVVGVGVIVDWIWLVYTGATRVVFLGMNVGENATIRYEAIPKTGFTEVNRVKPKSHIDQEILLL